MIDETPEELKRQYYEELSLIYGDKIAYKIVMGEELKEKDDEHNLWQ